MNRPLPLQKIIRITGIALSLVIGGTIVLLSLLPSSQMIDMNLSWLPFADKGAHMLAYAALGFSLFIACIRIPGSGKTPSWKRYMSSQNLRLTSWSGFAAMEVLLIGIVIGVTMELLQPLTGRSMEFADFIADVMGLMVGTAFGLLVLHLLSKWLTVRPWLYDPNNPEQNVEEYTPYGLCIKDSLSNALATAAVQLSADVQQALDVARNKQAADLQQLISTGGDAQQIQRCSASLRVFDMIGANLQEARRSGLPMCQDTGMFVAYIDYPVDCPISMQELQDLVNQATSDAVGRANMRRSVVSDPVFERKNTQTNLPVMFHWNPVEGRTLRIGILLKGFGSENCSSVRMVNPTGGPDAVVQAVVDIMAKAGGKPCPPVFLGVGVGGTMDIAAALSKQALLKRAGTPNDDPRYAQLEEQILSNVQALGIGAGGFGGTVTALDVSVLAAPTHIAGMPVAVSVNCWADRKVVLEFEGWGAKTLEVHDVLASEEDPDDDL